MSRFPDPIDLPEHVYRMRNSRELNLIRAAKWGIVIRTLIILLELFGVFWWGSHSLMMDALSSLVDVASTFFLVLCIKLASRPPDKNHPFGHGRFEPLAGLLLGLTLVVIGFGMLLSNTSNLVHETSESISPFVWTIPFTALVLLELTYQIVMFVARKENSPALLADAFHYRIDGLTSLFATVALISAAFYPAWGAAIDLIGAIAISLLMIGLGLFAAKSNLHQVLDSPPPSRYFDRVRAASMKVEGVMDTEKLKIQCFGPDAHVDIDIEVDPKLTVDVAHEISQKVRVEIQKEWAAVRDVTVHIEPYYAHDHS